MKRLLPAIVFLTMTAIPPALADDWGPWEVRQEQPKPLSSSSSPLQFAVRLFQKYISPVDGARCPMYPTCSAYSLQALHKHGPLLGTFLTVDRLFHEGDAHEQQKPISIWGYIRFSDPLENNDFWLRRVEPKTP